MNSPIRNNVSIPSPCNTYLAGGIPWKTNRVLKGYNALGPPSLTQMFFLGEIHVFLQLSCVDLLGTKWAFLLLDNYDLPWVFLSRTYSSLRRKQGEGAAASKIDGSFEEILAFRKLSWMGHVNKMSLNYALKTLICRRYSFEQVPQFSLENNALDGHSSNTDGCLWTDTYVYFSWRGLFVFNKVIIFPIFNTMIFRIFSFQKPNQ